jgi:hypothetical protein
VSFKGLCRALPAPRIPMRELACFSLHPHADMVVIVFQFRFPFPSISEVSDRCNWYDYEQKLRKLFESGVIETAFESVIGVPELIACEAQPSFAFIA